MYSVCGGNDKFVSIFMLSEHVKDFLYLPLRVAFMLGIPIFPTAALLCIRLFIAVVAEKSTPNVKFRSHFNSDLPPCE